MTLPTPFRLEVLIRLTAAIADGGEPGEHVHDLGVSDDAPEGRVFRGRGSYGENDPLPMVALIEDPRRVEHLIGTGASTTSAGAWWVFVQGFVEDDHLNPTDPAYRLAADVVRRLALVRHEGKLARDILGLGNRKPCVEDILIGAPVVRPPEEGISAKAYFWLPLCLKLVEDHANPFT